MKRNAKIVFVCGAVIVIVAFFIFFIRLSCIGCVPPVFTLNRTGSSLLMQASVNLGVPSLKTVSFGLIHNQDDTLDSSILAKTSSAGIAAGNICLSKGYYANDESLSGPSSGGFGSAIKYSGTEKYFDVKLIAICDDGSRITGDVDGKYTKLLRPEWFSNCKIPAEKESETFCFFALNKYAPVAGK